MPRYTFNGKTYNIPDEKVDSFSTKNLNAEPLNINSFKDVSTTEEIEKNQQKDLANQIAVTKDNPDNMVFEELPEQYGLSNTNQGAFGYQTNYFTPRPLQPELNIEEYDIESKEKEYKIDTEEKIEKFKKKQAKKLDKASDKSPAKRSAVYKKRVEKVAAKKAKVAKRVTKRLKPVQKKAAKVASKIKKAKR